MTGVYPATYRRRLYAACSDSLTGVDLAVLGVLAHLAEHARDGGWFTVTQRELAQRTRLDRRTIGRRLAVCQALGWIEVRTTVRNGHYQASQYRLAIPDRAAESPTDQGTQSPTVRGTQSPTVRGTQSPRRGVTESQRLRSKSLVAADDAPHSGGGGSDDSAPPKTDRPDIPDNPSRLLDELGIRRRRKA